MRSHRRLIALGMAALITGCVIIWWPTIRSMILPPVVDELTLFSLDGSKLWPGDEPSKEGELFHSIPVMGKAEISNNNAKREILDALDVGLTYQGDPAKCFEPHHGIRTTKDGVTIDYIICFSCYQYRKIGPGIYKSGVIGDAPRAVLDRYLGQHTETAR
jgi:hypothetical protein